MMEDPIFDNLLKEAVKARGIASPGADFVPRLLLKTRQKPLIPKMVLFCLVLLFFCTLFSLLFLSAPTGASGQVSLFFERFKWLPLSFPEVEFKIFTASSTFSLVVVFACFPVYLHFMMKKKTGT